MQAGDVTETLATWLGRAPVSPSSVVTASFRFRGRQISSGGRAARAVRQSAGTG